MKPAMSSESLKRLVEDLRSGRAVNAHCRIAADKIEALTAERDKLKERVAELEDAGRSALFKLDIEFKRLPDTEHLEGWAEANRLRAALEKDDIKASAEMEGKK